MAYLTENKKTKNKILPNTISGASLTVQILEKNSVDCIFGYPGSSVLKLYDELSKNNNIKHVLMRHEQAAVHSAEGFARVSGKTGVVLVTSGPAVTNTITGLMNAYVDGFPLVLIAGVVNKELIGTGCFQDIDVISLTKSCSKAGFVVTDIKDLATTLDDAFKIAQSGKKGPVVVGVSKNVFDERITPSENGEIIELDEISNSDINETNLSEIIGLINNSKSPLILVGGGCRDCSAPLKSFVEKANIPVVTTLMGRGAFPDSHPLNMGMIGKNGDVFADKLLHQCDLLIALGSRYSNLFGSIKSKIIRVNVESQNFGKNDEYKVTSNVFDFLNSVLNSKIEVNNFMQWAEKQAETKSELNLAEFAIKELYEQTKMINPIIVTEVGSHQISTAKLFKFEKEKSFLTSGGIGTMGFGFPASIGACFAKPNENIFLIAGDGSFQMNIQELAVCYEHNLPVKIMVINNSGLGLIKEQQEELYDARYFQSEMINPDFVNLAKSYKIKAVSAKTKNEIQSAISQMINYKKSFLLEIVV